MKPRDRYWSHRCVDCHRLIRLHGDHYVWNWFLPNSTIPVLTGPLHQMHLTRYGWDRVWTVI